MGLFYTNIILYKVSRQKIINYFDKEKRIAYLSVSAGDFSVVYDKNSENQDKNELMRLAESLTRKLHCSALASLVHDSDIFLYWLYENGKLVDTYDSLPDYFEAESKKSMPEGGDAEILCATFDKPEAKPEIRHIFSLVKKGNISTDGSEEDLLGEDIHVRLVKSLGMPSFGACIGYFAILNSYLPEGIKPETFTKLPVQ
jgi:hypothetical protein